MTPLLSDYSIVLGYASGLCERGMVPVATRLLTLAISLPTTNQITTNKRYASKCIIIHYYVCRITVVHTRVYTNVHL